MAFNTKIVELWMKWGTPIGNLHFVGIAHVNSASILLRQQEATLVAQELRRFGWSTACPWSHRCNGISLQEKLVYKCWYLLLYNDAWQMNAWIYHELNWIIMIYPESLTKLVTHVAGSPAWNQPNFGPAAHSLQELQDLLPLISFLTCIHHLGRGSFTPAWKSFLKLVGSYGSTPNAGCWKPYSLLIFACTMRLKTHLNPKSLMLITDHVHPQKLFIWIIIVIWLLWFQPLWTIWVSWDFPQLNGTIKNVTTNQRLYIYIYIDTHMNFCVSIYFIHIHIYIHV